MARPAVRFPLTIYYDASCPLCASEMHTLAARDAARSLVLVDCSAPEFDDKPTAKEGVTRALLLERIHARDAAARWISGVDVFAVAYRAAGLGLPARLFASRRLRPRFERLYPWIAAIRYPLSRFGLQHAFRLLGTGRRSREDEPHCLACTNRERH